MKLYIENIISMALLDDIIAEVRNNIVEYFFKLNLFIVI